MFTHAQTPSSLSSYHIRGNKSMQSDHYITAINFCELSLDKSNHVMQNRTMVIRGYPLSDLIAFKLNFYKWSRKIKKNFLQRTVTEILKAGWQFLTKKPEKIHKICRNDLSVFALRNLIGRLSHKSLCGLLVYRRIMPSGERLFSKFHSCFTSRPTVHFLTIFQPLAKSFSLWQNLFFPWVYHKWRMNV